MAYVKKTYYKKKKSLKKTGSSSNKKMVLYKKPIDRVISYKRIWCNNNITFNTALTAGFWQRQQITFASIPNNAELKALFYNYRICGIKYTYMPRYSMVPQVSTGTHNQYYITLCKENNSANLINPSGTYSQATLNTLLENPKAFTRRFNKPVSIYYKPSVFDDIDATAISTVRYSPWISTLRDTAAHRGHHVFVWDNNFSATPVGMNYQEMITVYLQVKGFK